jgi:hypothetical protein
MNIIATIISIFSVPLIRPIDTVFRGNGVRRIV